MSTDPLATLIYDDLCPRCTRFAQWSRRWSQGRLRTVPLAEPGSMDLHPNLSYPRAVKAPQLILANGYLCEGAEAVAWAIGLRPSFSFVTVLYHLPLLRQLAGLLYWLFKARPKGCETCP